MTKMMKLETARDCLTTKTLSIFLASVKLIALIQGTIWDFFRMKHKIALLLKVHHVNPVPEMKAARSNIYLVYYPVLQIALAIAHHQ